LIYSSLISPFAKSQHVQCTVW